MIGYVGSWRVNSQDFQNAIRQMEKDGVIMVLVEGTDGKVYMNKVATKVAAGGCEG